MVLIIQCKCKGIKNAKNLDMLNLADLKYEKFIKYVYNLDERNIDLNNQLSCN